MGKEKQVLGKWGEDQAKEYIKSLGYYILDENFRCPHGEVDLIAMDKEALVFIEVKTRRSLSFGTPGQAVNLSKQKKYCKIAMHYIKEKRLFNCSLRFDIIEIMMLPHNQEGTINHIPDAFQATGHRYYY